MMKKFAAVFLILVLVAAVLAGSCQPAGPAQAQEVRVGIIRGFTGAVAAIGQELANGVDWVFGKQNYQVAGKKIVVLQEDEGETPDAAVGKAKKLVEQDRVNVILGPLLADSTMAVQGYLKQKGVPQVAFGPSDEKVSSHTFWTYATGRGSAYVGGLWAATDMGWKRATFLYTDYLFSQQLKEGFTAGFTEKGGTVVGSLPVPWPETDMAPYLTKVSNTDVLVVFLVPAAATFVKQYREFGLKVPVFFMSALMYEEPLLKELGDAVLDMYGTTFYSPEIDTPANKAFVKEFKDRYGHYPQFGTVQGYWPATLYLAALKATNGDTDPTKVTNAMLAVKSLETPAGPLTFTTGRTAIQNYYILKAVKKDRITWDVVKTYQAVEPR